MFLSYFFEFDKKHKDSISTHFLHLLFAFFTVLHFLTLRGFLVVALLPPLSPFVNVKPKCSERLARSVLGDRASAAGSAAAGSAAAGSAAAGSADRFKPIL